MNRLLALLAAMALTSGILLGCGGNEPYRTSPGTDTRTALEKETDDQLQKSAQEYNKKVTRRR